jgi:hypothetical protein
MTPTDRTDHAHRPARTVPLLLGLAGLSWWVGQTLLPDMGMEWPQRLAAVSAARDRQAAASALLVLAGVLLVLGSWAAAQTIRPGRGARLLTLGTAGLALGGVWLAAGRGAFSLHLFQATDPEVSRDAGLSVLAADLGPGFLVLVLTLPALLLGPVLIGVGLQRSGATGWLPLVLWTLGIGTFVATEFTVKAAESLGIGLAAVALTLMGRALSRRTGVGHDADESARSATAMAASRADSWRTDGS